jgi:hypothetical protein
MAQTDAAAKTHCDTRSAIPVHVPGLPTVCCHTLFPLAMLVAVAMLVVGGDEMSAERSV